MTFTAVQLAIPIVIFMAGFLAGFFTRDYVSDKYINNGSYVLVIVTTMWALSMFIDITSVDYQTPTLVHGLMGAIVGFFYKSPQKK